MRFQCSSLATVIGMNRFETISKEFERLWRATSRSSFQAAFLDVAEEGVQARLDAAIADVPRAKSAISDAKTAGGTARCTDAVTSHLKVALQDIEMETKRLNDQKAVLSAEHKDVTAIEKDMASRELVKAEICKSANTEYGTMMEGDGIAQYEQQQGLLVCRTPDDCWRCKQVLPDVSLVGRVDGLIADDCVLEVKNRTRMRNMGNTISVMDNIQVQAYLFLHDRPRAVLLQCFKQNGSSTLKPIDVCRDDIFWSDVIVERLKKCVELLRLVCDDPAAAKKYTNMDASSREAYLIAHITQAH